MNNIEKLNGANFSLWKSQMEGRPILKDQYLLIEGVGNKPSSMTDEDWNKLDKKSIATIRQYLAKKVYFNVARPLFEVDPFPFDILLQTPFHVLNSYQTYEHLPLPYQRSTLHSTATLASVPDHLWPYALCSSF